MYATTTKCIQGTSKGAKLLFWMQINENLRHLIKQVAVGDSNGVLQLFTIKQKEPSVNTRVT